MARKTKTDERREARAQRYPTLQIIAPRETSEFLARFALDLRAATGAKWTGSAIVRSLLAALARRADKLNLAKVSSEEDLADIFAGGK